MKACPTCNRTYPDDTLAFCLVDGTILSAPYDPQQTLHLPASRSTEQSPAQPTLPPTIRISDPQLFIPEKPQPQFREKPRANPWKAFGIILSLVIIVGAGLFFGLNWSGKDTAAENRPGPNVANTNTRPSPTPTPRSTPSATPETHMSWGARTDASINEGDRITYYRGTTPDQCQADCDRNPRCRAFTYIRAGAYNANDPPMCYLMASVKVVNPSSCCITAIKN